MSFQGCWVMCCVGPQPNLRHRPPSSPKATIQHAGMYGYRHTQMGNFPFLHSSTSLSFSWNCAKPAHSTQSHCQVASCCAGGFRLILGGVASQTTRYTVTGLLLAVTFESSFDARLLLVLLIGTCFSVEGHVPFINLGVSSAKTTSRHAITVIWRRVKALLQRLGATAHDTSINFESF